MIEGGNFINYEIGLRQKYGDEKVDELKEAGAINPVFKRTKPDLIEIIEHYKSLLVWNSHKKETSPPYKQRAAEVYGQATKSAQNVA